MFSWQYPGLIFAWKLFPKLNISFPSVEGKNEKLLYFWIQMLASVKVTVHF